MTEDEAFEKAITRTLLSEGAANTVAGDKGGTTKYGLSQRFLSAVSGSPVSSAYVLSLSLNNAKDIYRNHFWSGPRINRIADHRLREIVFDQAVNRGQGVAIKNLQKAVHKLQKMHLAIDGILGPKTLESISSIDAESLRLSYIMECQTSYASICVNDPSQLKFLVGWINRTWTYFS